MGPLESCCNSTAPMVRDMAFCIIGLCVGHCHGDMSQAVVKKSQMPSNSFTLCLNSFVQFTFVLLASITLWCAREQAGYPGFHCFNTALYFLQASTYNFCIPAPLFRLRFGRKSPIGSSATVSWRRLRARRGGGWRRSPALRYACWTRCTLLASRLAR